MIVVDCIQGEEAWFSEKLGKPSSSNISKIVTAGGKKSTQREGYLHSLIAERLTGERSEGYKNENMEEGNRREQESRDMYSFLSGHEVEQVGVVYKDSDKRFLSSPDGLCNNREYGLELKNVLPKTQVKYLLRDKTPSEYVIQVQSSLMISGLPFWKFVSYCPNLDPLIVTVDRDALLIKMIEDSLNKFCDELDFLTNKLKGK